MTVRALREKTITVRVCTGSACVMSGSLATAERLEKAIEAAGAGDRVRVVRTGCHGLCEIGPVAVVGPDDVFYPDVDEEKAARIIDGLFGGGTPIAEYLYRHSEGAEPVTRYGDIPFNRIQKRVASRNCGLVDPEDIGSAVAHGVYEGLKVALDGMTPERVIDAIRESRLRGRGGGGFPTGEKWDLCRRYPGSTKYVIANAACTDRIIMEGDPHSVLEGMIICAWAIGDARKGYIGIRDEHTLAIQRIEIALEQAREAGMLGENILDSGLDFDIEVHRGAGGFVCGESTALINSIEGRRGTPRVTPPHAVERGLFGRPTVLNNVETFANVGWILSNGASAFADIGLRASGGSKVIALTGKTRLGGFLEAPLGTTVGTLVFDAGGGCPGDTRCKAVQVGGPTGGYLPESLFGTSIDFEALEAVGTIVGSGEILVMDEHDCMVDVTRHSLSFSQQESCGTCAPCRIGTKRMLEIVTRICAGQGRREDLDVLERLATDVQRSSLCGLGRTAPNPVLTALRYFRHEFDEHIVDQHCRAGRCAEISTFRVIDDVCTGCGVCKKHCPVDAISGVLRSPHAIDEAKCIKCGLCESHCPFDAIRHT